MISVEEVNKRVTDLASTQRQDVHELYAWSRLEDISMAFEALIRTQEACDMVTRAFGRIHALEARDPARPDDLEDTSSSVADALVEYEANKSSGNGDDSHDSGSGRRRTEHTTRECMYRDFLKFQPLNFKGTEGVVKGTNVVSYTQRFQELALMCGRMFPKESNKVEKYVGGLTDMIQGSVMASKTRTLQDAIEFANDLMDQKIRTFAEIQAKNKRKLDDNQETTTLNNSLTKGKM
ncbi:hypothetical protein Tco_0109970 [Tanacetum coccineum]